jgi:succinate dehydrogenase/fumarate reductase flavoprotein subunit
MATKVMDCDLLVIGAGGYGMTCAVKAADLLAGKKVIVIEKAKKTGGATILAHGPNQIYDSTWQRKAGAEPQEPQGLSGQWFDWLVSKGGAEKYFKVGEISFMGKPAQKVGIDMPRRIDKYKDLDDPSIGPGWWGSYIVDKMLECCLKMNVPVLTETRAKRFIKDFGGRITGVIADTNDGELQVNFKACFIGAGGFGADYKKCQALWPKVYNNKPMHCLVPPSLTGDLIDAAQEAGTGIDLKNAGCNTQGPYHHPYSYTVHIMAKTEVMNLQINPSGERVPTQGWSGRPGEEFENPLVYAIGDQKMMEKAAELAPQQISEPGDKERVKKWREDIAEEASIDEKGRYGRHTTKADTIVELALKLGMDPNVLRASIEKYNKECESASGAAQMPVKKGPFYAIFLQPFMQCTHGGIIVNADQEVMDAQGNVMPGLYAGGDCTTEYTINTGSQAGGPSGAPGGQPGQGGAPGGQGGAPKGGGGGPMSRAGLFGNYKAGTGGGMMGLHKGIIAATKIAEYLKKA